MDVVKTLRPGKNGTKRYVELYGDNLVAVRYRLDAEKQLSYTTVELIIERRAAPLKGFNDAAYRLHQNQRPVLLRILRHETELGFYPISTDGLKRAENFKSCRATLRRIRGLWNRSM